MCDELGLETLPDDQHRLIPYSLVLMHYLAKWRAAHADQLPSNAAEQREFKAMVQQGRRRTADPTFEEENFDEALKNVRQAWQRTAVPQHVQDIFARPEVLRLSREVCFLHPFTLPLSPRQPFPASACSLLPSTSLSERSRTLLRTRARNAYLSAGRFPTWRPALRYTLACRACMPKGALSPLCTPIGASSPHIPSMIHPVM